MNLVFMLYREIHYRIVQRNPILANNPARYRQALKNALSVKRGLGIQFANYLFLGLFGAMGIAFTKDEAIISTFSVFLSVIPFVFALYITSIQGSNVVYMGVFEPLKILPVKMGSRLLSAYLLLEVSPSFAIVIPTAGIIIWKYPLAGILSLLWFIVGIFMGHVFGLIILTFFGLKVRQSAGKKEMLANIIRAIFFFLFIGMFYAFVYMQNYVRQHAGEWAGVIGKYSLIYPFSVGTIFDPIYSATLLAIYGAILITLYYSLLGSVWKRIMEPNVISGSVEKREYRVVRMGTVHALLLKDFKILIRRTALLAGFLIIVYIVFPQLFIALSTGRFPVDVAVPLLFTVGVLAATGVDAVLKIDVNSLDFLRTLPLRKRDFVISKIIAVCIVPWALGFVMLLLAIYYNGTGALILLPYPIMLPFISSSVSMLYYFHYKGEDIGIPDLRWGDMLLLLLLISLAVAPAAIPVIFHMYILSEVILLLESLLFIYFLRK